MNGSVEVSMNGTACSPLSSPLARNISPVIANLLKTVQVEFVAKLFINLGVACNL